MSDESETTREVVGVELWQAVLTLLTEHPEVWNQTTWLDPSDDFGSDEWPLVVDRARPHACGTVGCLAGHAVVLSGRYPLRVHAGDVEALLPQEVTNHAESWWEVGHWAREIALDLLGLTSWRADVAFAGSRSLAELWALAERWTDGAVQPPNWNEDRRGARRWTDAELARARAWADWVVTDENGDDW